jgi:hypothetical protein
MGDGALMFILSRILGVCCPWFAFRAPVSETLRFVIGVFRLQPEVCPVARQVVGVLLHDVAGEGAA